MTKSIVFANYELYKAMARFSLGIKGTGYAS